MKLLLKAEAHHKAMCTHSLDLRTMLCVLCSCLPCPTRLNSVRRRLAICSCIGRRRQHSVGHGANDLRSAEDRPI